MMRTSPSATGTGVSPSISHQQDPPVITWYETTCWTRGRMAGARREVEGAAATQGVEASTTKKRAPVSLTASRTSERVSAGGLARLSAVSARDPDGQSWAPAIGESYTTESEGGAG